MNLQKLRANYCLRESDFLRINIQKSQYCVFMSTQGAAQASNTYLRWYPNHNNLIGTQNTVLMIILECKNLKTYK